MERVVRHLLHGSLQEPHALLDRIRPADIMRSDHLLGGRNYTG